MTEQEFKAIVDAINIPHTYMFYPEKKAPELPYFVWYFSESDNFGADDEVYAEILVPVIELYTQTKSFTDETAVESVLTGNGFFWNKSSTYIDSEKMLMTTYEIGEICKNGEQN